jgi:hypothetical protein
VGDWGESLVEETLKLQGYEVHQVKLPGNQGIDRIAIKRLETGEIFDARIVEVKTHRGAMPRLGDTLSGKQMSEQWIADRLEAMRNSTDPAIQKLGNEIEAFRQEKGLPLEKLGEVQDINTRTGRYTIRDAQLNEKASYSIERNLKDIQKRLPEHRAWATSHLAEYDQIKATEIADYLEGKPGVGIKEPPHSVTNPAQRAAKIPNEPPHGFGNPFRSGSEVETAPSVKSLARQALRESTEMEAASVVECLEVNSAKRATKVAFANLERGSSAAMTRAVARQGVKGVLRRVARLAGPIGVAVGVALSAEELARHVLAYRRGEKSYREMCIGISGSLGGIGGAFAGATTGAYLGAFGGPFAWITVPACATIGGIVGYMGGSAIGTALANSWFDHIDDRLRHRLTEWLCSAKMNELVPLMTGM